MNKLPCLLIAIGCLLFWVNRVDAKSDFVIISEKQCYPIEISQANRLPSEFQKYINYTKKCDVKDQNNVETKLSIVSIWVDEYYLSFSAAGRTQRWENFPLPVIVTDNFKVIGRLPEIYPRDDVTEPEVFFGKWENGMPKEIRIDVTNPAVDGDYFYPPIFWNSITQQYEMKKGEVIHGRRR
ncbi:hypothetical protein [Geomesophilobacter sediminis]|uniref:Uncharacterized protein n=1 Tax=Geomesophilobacter sediminis TaxID=2798584 RepID=A0A8J7J6P8_9BACT|nr:hypothetical protein [Geomesophilobacter sediminis]MBJ6724526.1 hypothetical protein [Geomesophilobacter sediminis]